MFLCLMALGSQTVPELFKSPIESSRTVRGIIFLRVQNLVKLNHLIRQPQAYRIQASEDFHSYKNCVAECHIR